MACQRALDINPGLRLRFSTRIEFSFRHTG